MYRKTRYMDIDNEPHILLLPPPSTSTPPARKMPTIPQLAIALGALAFIFALSYLPIRANQNNKAAERVVEQVHEDRAQKSEIDYYKEVRVSADAAYVWDVKNQRALYNKNADKRLPLASLTKLMTALVAYERLNATDRISITKQAVLEYGDSNLASGETFALHDLVNLMLITSSNDGASALAAAAGATFDSGKDPTDAFIDAMNAKAEELGLSRSHFSNPTGLDVSGTKSGSYGSARDMAFLMEYLVVHHPEILEATKEAVSTIHDRKGVRMRAINTNEITSRIPGLIGSKTGFTGLAGGNLVIAYNAGLNRPIVIAVLGGSREGRFGDVLMLIKQTATVLANE